MIADQNSGICNSDGVKKIRVHIAGSSCTDHSVIGALTSNYQLPNTGGAREPVSLR